MSSGTDFDIRELRGLDEESPLYAFYSDPDRRGYQLICGRCYWTGDWFLDYWYHVKNWHPLLSCFLCDPCNLYTRVERWSVFCLGLILSMLPTAAMMVWFEDRHVDPWFDKFSVFVCITFPLMIVQYTIEYAIYFREVFKHQSTRRCTPFCLCLHHCMHCVNLYLLISLVILALICLCIGSYYVRHERHTVMLALWPLCISRVEFWGIWFLTDLFFPFIGFFFWWRKERRREKVRLQILEQRRLYDAAESASVRAEIKQRLISLGHKWKTTERASDAQPRPSP